MNSTKEANDAAILKERLLELAFEGKRWWDLVRFDKAFDLVPSLREHKGGRLYDAVPHSFVNNKRGAESYSKSWLG